MGFLSLGQKQAMMEPENEQRLATRGRPFCRSAFLHVLARQGSVFQRSMRCIGTCSVESKYMYRVPVRVPYACMYDYIRRTSYTPCCLPLLLAPSQARC